MQDSGFYSYVYILIPLFLFWTSLCAWIHVIHWCKHVQYIWCSLVLFCFKCAVQFVSLVCVFRLQQFSWVWVCPAPAERDVLPGYNRRWTLITEVGGVQPGYKRAELTATVTDGHHDATAGSAVAAPGGLRWVAAPPPSLQIKQKPWMNFPALVVYGCGSPAVQPDTSRVVNGEEARPHSWPWQVLTPPVLCFYSQVGKIEKHKWKLSTCCFPPDLVAGEARQPLPSHLWGDADRTPLGADGWTLHLVKEEGRVSESHETGNTAMWWGCFVLFLFCPGPEMFTAWSWGSTTWAFRREPSRCEISCASSSTQSGTSTSSGTGELVCKLLERTEPFWSV